MLIIRSHICSVPEAGSLGSAVTFQHHPVSVVLLGLRRRGYKGKLLYRVIIVI